jgi:alpha-ribazole phosphatase
MVQTVVSGDILTRILLARHGETEWNAIGRVQGWTDIPLSALGIAQARALGERLRDTPLTAVYSSDLCRAIQTAAPTAAQQGLEIQRLSGLREKGYGDWEGLTREDLERDYAALWHRYHKERDLEAVVPGGETWPEVQGRMQGVLQTILAAHPGAEETVLLVGHGGSARALILEALQAPLPTLLHLHLSNGSLSRLDFVSETDSRVVFLNDTGHLAGVTA